MIIIVIILNILLLNITLLMWEQFIVFEFPIQSISSTGSLEKLIKPTHDVVKKKKRKRKRGEKISLPNNVAPIIVVPHENEDDALDDDLVMPISCCDDYDWEDNDIPYDLEIFLALAWKNIIIAILLVLSILLMMRVIMLMI